jgi:hypothetical protein
MTLTQLLQTSDNGIYELVALPREASSEVRDSAVDGKRGQGSSAIFVARNRLAVLDKTAQVSNSSKTSMCMYANLTRAHCLVRRDQGFKQLLDKDHQASCSNQRDLLWWNGFAFAVHSELDRSL